MIEELLKKIKSYSPNADLSLVSRAYERASRVHEGQKRLSGEPFLTHPLAVAMILAELEQDPVTIAAALLHDTIEDGGLSQGVIASEFSPEIARLVEGVTKLGQLTFESREERQAENFRKMFLAMGEDIRTIIIKLADRLHNMQTLQYLPEYKQKETSFETREIFAPLAHRLGMWRLKWELEDLSFRFLEPDEYNKIKASVDESRRGRESYISTFIEKLSQKLKDGGIEAQINGRAKHFYSIYRKMADQHLEFDEIYDLTAVRIIVESVKDCYEVLGNIHASWKPVPGRFRDYIAMPKSNGYQSLHTTVIGPDGRPVEIQIRTKEMHKTAEYGIAAHWRYKEGKTDKELDTKMAWLRQMLDWQGDMKDAKDFMESLKIDLFPDEVFVFTPKGEVFPMPVDATPVDFAYRVHTEVGHRCMGARVNGRIVPLNHRLKSGNIVEIITSKTDTPKLDWLNFVKTPGARAKIKGWFKRLKREDNILLGRQAFEIELKKLGISLEEALEERHLKCILREYSVDSLDDLYVGFGNGEISAYQAAKRSRALVKVEHQVSVTEEEKLEEKVVQKKRQRKKGAGVAVTGFDNVLVKFSRCCRPLPGDDIVGFVTKGRGVSIHKKDCPNVVSLVPTDARMVRVDWVRDPEIIYPVEIEVEAFDRVGVLKDILEKVVETQTNVSAANVKTKRGSSAFIKLIVDIRDVDHLGVVMKAIRDVSDVYDVYRVDIIRRAKGSGKDPA